MADLDPETLALMYLTGGVKAMPQLYPQPGLDPEIENSVMFKPDVTSDFTAPSIESAIDILDFTPAGDALAGLEAAYKRDILGVTLALASMPITGTLKPVDRMFDMSVAAKKARAIEQDALTSERLIELLKDIGVTDVTPPVGTNLKEPITFFHGTGENIKKFKSKMRGTATSADSAKLATWASNLPSDANAYTSSLSPPRLERALDIEDKALKNYQKARNELNKVAEEGLAYKRMENAKKRYETIVSNLSQKMDENAYHGNPNIIPLYVKTKNPMVVNKEGGGFGDLTKKITEAKAKGHDSVVFYNIHDPTPGAIHIAGFEPNQFRVPWAGFDPFKKDSADLLAGLFPALASTAAIGSLLEEQE